MTTEYDKNVPMYAQFRAILCSEADICLVDILSLFFVRRVGGFGVMGPGLTTLTGLLVSLIISMEESIVSKLTLEVQSTLFNEIFLLQ